MQRIIYIHIPKTGGSTMRQVMTQNVGRQHLFAVGKRHAKQVPWFFNLPQAERDSFQNVLGHIRYGVHRWFSTGTASYFTFLRNPIERTLSAYSYSLETTTLPHHEKVKSLTFEGYLREFDTSSVQTRWLLGYVDETPENGGNGSHIPAYYGMPGYPVPPDAVEIVKRRLETEFSVTGLVERYDESLLLLQAAYGWDNVYYYRSNVTSKRLRYKDLTADQKRALDAVTGPDYEIFEWAKARLETQIAAQGEPFQQRLAEFKRVNPEIGERRRRWKRLRRRVRRFLHLPKSKRHQ